MIKPAPDVIDRLFSESLIIDGLVNLGRRRGQERAPLARGEIKRNTGINCGAHTTRISSLLSWDQWIKQQEDALLKIERAGDIELCWRTNRYGILYYVQSDFDLRGSTEVLSEWKDRGIRILQLTYNDNEIGGGTESDNLPITAFGRKVVKELNRLKMVVDVSHCGKRTTLDATEVSCHPVTSNHSNAEALSAHPRNKSDEELLAIARTGGVVGITTVNRFLLRTRSRPANIDDLVAQIDYAVEKIGVDHVAVSSDAYMDGSQRYEVDFSDKFINSLSRWRFVANKLHEKGYAYQDLQKIFGLNFKRVYDTVLDS